MVKGRPMKKFFENLLKRLLKPGIGIGGMKQLRCNIKRLFGKNRSIPWPVHHTSRVSGFNNISYGRRTYPGYSDNCYIQAINGIKFGSNVRIGPGVAIISANHNLDDFEKHQKADPIEIGDNCWLGARAVILPGVKLGDHVIVGAGSIVTKSFSSNCVIAGNPAIVIKQIGEYTGRKY